MLGIAVCIQISHGEFLSPLGEILLMREQLRPSSQCCPKAHLSFDGFVQYEVISHGVSNSPGIVLEATTVLHEC